MRSLQSKIRFAALALACCLLLSGCGVPAALPEALADAIPKKQSEPASSAADRILYEAPTMATVEFHADQAKGKSGVKIDLSSVAEGYVAISAVSEKRLKLQVLYKDLTYTYNIASDGTPSFFPLQCGNGHYTFRVMENISDNKYAQLYRTECDVKLLDEFQPFIRPSDYSMYDENSKCVKKAAELAESCSTPLEVVSAVYKFVTRTIRYDDAKAAAATTIYMPDVDETLATRRGICFDYAALTAAMLRSQGIPTKIIFGYVAPDDLYHAWNMFYTEESGWVTVKFEVSANSWNRVDLTFAAGGASAAFVGDGSNYTEVYFY